MQEKKNTPTAMQQGEKQVKKYKCRVKECKHDPFQTKHALARHLLVFHKKMGSMCDICGDIMSKHHLAQQMDKHYITKRFECNEKIGKNATCKKAYKQKSTLIRHIIEKHNKNNIEVANIKIRHESEVVYETSVDYEKIAEK